MIKNSIAREKGRRKRKNLKFAQLTDSSIKPRRMPHHVLTSIAGNQQSKEPQASKLEQPPKAALDMF